MGWTNYVCENQYQIKAKHQVLKFFYDFPDNKSSLILSGRPGTGKTHLGIAAMLKLISNNITCKYVEYNNMIVNLKQLTVIISSEKTLEEMLDFDEVVGSRYYRYGKVNSIILQNVIKIIKNIF